MKNRDMWNTLKELICKHKTEVYNEIKFGDTNITNTKGIVNSFNNYFIESINEIVRSISVINTNTANPGTRPLLNCKLIDFKLLKTDELRNIIIDMKNKSSKGEIHISLVKFNFDEIADKLIYIMYCSLELGIEPNK